MMSEQIIPNKCKLKHDASFYERQSFKWRQRIGFGISDYACNLAYLLVNTYLLFYYTNCAMLPAAAVGVMFAITKVFDGVTDYTVGVLIDRTNTKMGRNRPWMLFGAPVLAVGMVLLFCVPTGWSTTGKLAWAYITYVIFSFGYTMVNIPMGTIVPSLSNDAVERTKIVTARTVFANLGSLTSASMVIPMVYYFAGGKDASNEMLAVGYRNTNMILGIIVIIIMTICVASIEEINPPLIVKREKSATGGLIDDLKEVLTYKPFVLMLIMIFFMFWAYYLMFGAIQYFFTYVVGDVSKMSMATSIMTIVPIATQLLTPVLNRYVSKRNLMLTGTAIDFVAVAGIYFMGSNVTAIYMLLVVFGLGMGMRQVVYYSMLADCVDYGEWKSGRSLAGTQGAVNGFTGKVASALASAAMSALLVWGGYDATAKIQSAKALTAIKFGFAGATMLASAVCLLVIYFYDLDKKYPQIKAELDRKRNVEGEN